MSRGLDGQRRLLVVHESNTSWDVEPLSAADEKKAMILRATLREQSTECSVDQAKEMIRENTMTGETQIHPNRCNSSSRAILYAFLYRLCSSLRALAAFEN